MSLMLMLMKPTSSMSRVMYGPGPENRTQARYVRPGSAKIPRRMCSGRSSRTVSSARTIPWVFVLPPRS